MAYFGQSPKTWDKGPGMPVTEADLAVDALLHQQLIAARPGYGWLSEETHDDGSRRAHSTLFVVDPIDGTSAFIKRKPEFTICAASVHLRRPIAAAVFNPVTQEMFTAAQGHGTRRNGEAISVSRRNQIAGCRMLGSPAIFSHPAWSEPWPAMEISNRASIAYRMALIAQGLFDGLVALSPKKDWDIAAAELLVAEAGGVVSTHDGQTFLYNGEAPEQASLVCAGAALHPLLLQRTKSVRLP
ncbi:MAG: 3'(2'),5'-bisphosphate nucleotidase CysQ [Alphaproteobacteria bacterium]|nr:3'(2'),5'-bisphosphate nucleotidase CysQ [Alphaproteobacteria bacterium]